MITITLEEYYKLRKFKDNIEEGKVCRITPYMYSTEIHYMTKDSALLEITAYNNGLIQNTESLQKEIWKIKSYSIWKFLKWCKS